MIRVLHYIPAFGVGGIESLIINMYEKIDRNKVQFDFLSEKKLPTEIEIKIKKMGGEIYVIPKFTQINHIFRYLNDLNKIFKKRMWKVFHCHSWQTRPLPIIYAKFYKINTIIVHAHAINYNNNRFSNIIDFISKIGICCSNLKLACSYEAGISSFFGNEEFIIINNGIEIKKYKFSEKNRYMIRKKYLINDDQVININVGRITRLKNQSFLIDIYKELILKDPKQVLWILGSGKDKYSIQEKIKNCNMEDRVKLFENKDVSLYLSAADNFIFPSISEGLGISYIEAQVNGLDCFVSNGVPKSADVNNNVYRFNLEDDLKNIADLILSKKKTIREKNLNHKEIQRFSIENTVDTYIKIIERRNK